MKVLLYSLLTLLVLAYTAQGQAIPASANGIELTTNLADSTLFESVQSYLENAGFTIEKADEELGTLVTDYKVERGAVTMRILVSINQNVASFSGQGTFELRGQLYEDEELLNEGLMTDPITKGFVALNSVITRYAQTLEQATLEYSLP